MILDARPIAKPSRALQQAANDAADAQARVARMLAECPKRWDGHERRRYRPLRSPHAVNQQLAETVRTPDREPAEPPMTLRDVIAMSACYALVALLAWMVIDPTGFYLYLLGWLP